MDAAGVLVLLGLCACAVLLILMSRGTTKNAERTSRFPSRGGNGSEAAKEPPELFGEKTIWDRTVQFEGHPSGESGDLRAAKNNPGSPEPPPKTRSQNPQKRTKGSELQTPRRWKDGITALAAVLIFFGLPNSLKETRWRGHVYPDRDDLTRFISLGEFNSHPECHSAALQALQVAHDSRCQSCDSDIGACEECSSSPFEIGDWECNKNCEPDGFGGFICEE